MIILCCEPDSQDRQSLVGALEKDSPGFTILEAVGIQQAQAVLASQPVDIVIAESPSILELAQQICPGVPVIQLSSDASVERVVQSMRFGAVDYLLKTPQTYASLPRRVQEIAQHAAHRKSIFKKDSSILDAAGYFIHLLQSEKEPGDAICQGLKTLGEAVNASRAYIYENFTGVEQEPRFRLTYEWSAPGISSQLENSLFHSLSYLDAGNRRLKELLSKGETYSGLVKEFPEEERRLLEDQNIQSILISPLYINDQWWGFIGLDECRYPRRWEAAEIDALKSIGSALGGAMRQRSLQQVLDLSAERYRQVYEGSPTPLWEEDMSEVKSTIDQILRQGQDVEAYFDAHPDEVLRCLKSIRTIRCNKAYLDLYHISNLEDLSQAAETAIQDLPSLSMFKNELVQISRGQTRFETYHENFWVRGERHHVVLVWAVEPGHEKSFSRVLLSLRDVTLEKQTENTLRQDNIRYLSMFQDSPIPLWEEDFSRVKNRVEELRQGGVVDIQTHLEEHPEIVEECIRMVRVVDVNRAALNSHGVKSLQELIDFFPSMLSREAFLLIQNELIAIFHHEQRFESEGVNYRADGEKRDIQVYWVVAPGYEESYAKVFVSTVDITERKRAEYELRQSQERYKNVFEYSPVSLWEEDWSEVKKTIDDLHRMGVTDVYQFMRENPDAALACLNKIRTLDVNQASVKLYAAHNKQELLEKLPVIAGPLMQGTLLGGIQAVNKGENHFESTGVNYTLDGRTLDIYLQWTVADGYEDTYGRIIVSILDISEEKRVERSRQKQLEAEELLSSISSSLLTAGVENFEQQVGMTLYKVGQFIEAQRLLLYLLSEDNQSMTSLEWDISRGETRRSQKLMRSDFPWVISQLESGRIILLRSLDELPPEAQSERDYWQKKNIGAFLGIPLQEGNRLAGLLTVFWNVQNTDCAQDSDLMKNLALLYTNVIQRHRMEMEREILRQAIQGVLSSVDLDEVFEHLLTQLRWVVPYTSAAVHMCEGSNLRFVAGKGFPPEIQHAGRLTPIDEPMSCYVKDSLKPLVYGDVQQVADFARNEFESSIHSWMGIPLIWRGEFFGYVTVDHSRVNMYTERDASLAQDFANQASIAIANARLFDTAQRSAREWLLTFNAISDLILIADPDERLVRCNQALVNHLKMPVEELSGQKISRLLNGEKDISLSSLHGPVQFTCLPGWFEVSSFPIQVGETNSGAVHVIKDISERVLLQERMVQNQKLAGLGTLAAGIAHEMNTPLQIITGLSEIMGNSLSKQEIDLPTLQRKLNTINQSAWRLANIVRSLRAYSHTDSTEFQPQSLNDIIQDTLLLIEHQLRSWSTIEIITDLDSHLPPFTCDRNRISQSLINLITNSRDAMPRGGKIYISTRYVPARKKIVLEFADTGMGIPEAMRSKIFDPFFTTKPVGSGTGLGLYIVMGTVRSHGGEITLDSSPNEGTRFCLTFPENPSRPVEENSGRYTP